MGKRVKLIPVARVVAVTEALAAGREETKVTGTLMIGRARIASKPTNAVRRAGLRHKTNQLKLGVGG